MARLHEYQGKALLKKENFATPAGGVARSPEEARILAEELGAGTGGVEVVVKAQAWTTSRAAQGGIRFAASQEEAETAAREILALKMGGYQVEEVLVEEKIAIEREFYAGTIVDDAAAQIVLIISTRGGSGIEEIAEEHPESIVRRHIPLDKLLRPFEARNMLRKAGIHGKLQMQLAAAVTALVKTARKYEARSAEINPLVLTKDGRILAADARMTVDDYAVFRHPELGIDIAREFGHPPTVRERLAYEVEQNDHRGTFYFAELEADFAPGSGVVGFHGAGGGGSMMSMDAVMGAGYKIANFTDTSGNPSAKKVYRAARIILSIPNLDAYFGSGSGVASQEQFHSAYGLAKAFREVGLDIPAVLRLGGNSEDRAVDILERASVDLPGKVEGYKKDDTPDFCAGRLKTLIEENESSPRKNIFKKAPIAKPSNALTIDVGDGLVTIDLDQCDEATNAVLAEVCEGVLEIVDGKPKLAISEEEAASGRFDGWIAAEIECILRAKPALTIDLPVPGLDELIAFTEAHEGAK